MTNRRDLLKRVPAGLGVLAVGAGAMEPVPVESAPRHFMLLVLDRSGSMSSLQDSVIKGVNQLLDEQRNNQGLQIGIVQFDSFKNAADCFCDPIFDFTPAAQTVHITSADYVPRGGTPLLAAFAEAIANVEQMIRPIDRVLINVQTDGYENASPPEITKEVIRNLIEAKTAEGNWTFAFMGADIDAWAEGGSMGVRAGSTLQYANTGAGTAGAYSSLSSSTNTWYVNTGGGASYAVAMASPGNTNDSFFTQPAANSITANSAAVTDVKITPKKDDSAEEQ